MAIDWSNEDFSRLYKRETDDDLMLSWEAEAVWHKFLKKCDKSGYLATRRGVQGLAALLRIPLDVVERVLRELLEDGRLRSVPPNGFIAPNYVDANYTARSGNARQAAFRAKERVGSVSDCNDQHGAGAAMSHGVTPDNAESHGVTSGNENCQSINQSIQPFNHQSPSANDAPASKTKGRRGIPEDWTPRPEERQLARELGLNCESEAAEFLSFWLGDGRPKKNWDQTFRNRLQFQSKNGRGHVRQGSPSVAAPTRKLKEIT
jgi:hypothetical protein